jgi:hypothetical protein
MHYIIGLYKASVVKYVAFVATLTDFAVKIVDFVNGYDTWGIAGSSVQLSDHVQILAAGLYNSLC